MVEDEREMTARKGLQTIIIITVKENTLSLTSPAQSLRHQTLTAEKSCVQRGRVFGTERKTRNVMHRGVWRPTVAHQTEMAYGRHPR